MGGERMEQGEKARNVAQMFSHAQITQSGEVCQRGIAENKAYAGALVSRANLPAGECRLLAR